MSESIGFYYGVLMDDLKVQAEGQGFKIKDVEKFEKIRKAINMCMLHQIATHSQVDIMFRKLQKQIVKNLERLKK